MQMLSRFRTSGKTVEELIDKSCMLECTTSLKECLKGRYDIVITGTVGSGKSTVCDILYAIISAIDGVQVNTFPEFILFDRDFSEKMLDAKINGSISQLTFQSYVLDSWEQILSKTTMANNINIYERCPDDSVACFCNVANNDNTLTNNELITLHEKLLSLNNRYETVSYFNIDTHFTEIPENDLHSIMLSITKIIASDMKLGITKRVIGLNVSPETSIARINERGRNSELNYSVATILLYQRHYRKLFKYLSKHGHIKRLIDFGNLI